MIPDIIREMDEAAKRRFTYKADRGADRWQSFADDVLRNKAWEGDCDDLASTVLDLSIRCYGPVIYSLYRLCVRTIHCPPSVPYDHMVAGWMTRTQGLVIFGDTYGVPHQASRSPHKIVRHSLVSEGIVWRKGAP